MEFRRVLFRSVQHRIAVRRRPGVARRLERVAGTIELAAAVIFVTCHGTPAVLVEVEPPFGIDVTLAGIERGLDHPRSEERRGGKECGSTCRSRWSPYP